MVLRQGKCGWLKPQQAMAAFAAIRIRRGGKLRSVRILVTIETTLKFDFVERALPSRDVALRTGYGGMLPFQRISGRRVLPHSEGGGFEGIHGVAGGAFTAVGPRGELFPVGTGLVAVHALLKTERLIEIAAAVALHTFDGGVLAAKRKLGFGMVEALIESDRHDPVPARGAMAGFASLREGATVGIGMTGGTFGESNSRVTRLPVTPRSVAFLAGNLGMQSRQRVPRF